ncbi:FecR family protein [Mangrovibacterium sp.]|uniref:FecR family protein n=1 Tax=Mangrovibacterium sp. TaxID=1961364 RepID=UPI00356547D7
MDKILRYLENPDFVRWVYKPNGQNTIFWNEFQKDNPEEIGIIREAKTILLRLKPKKEILGPKIDSALPSIILKIRKKQQIRRIRQFTLSTFKYAAIAVLFFLTGLFIMKERYSSAIDEMSRQYANISYYNGEESRLVLADGKNIIISEKFSQIRYNEKGTIIIDQNDTISQNISGNNPMNQLIVPYGKNSSITLTDGTKAYLNAGSRLIFPPVFEDETREVFLVGEGYFDVARNPHKPFIVKTTDINVTALGTAFNVSAYPTESKIEVVLAEGKVNINKNEFALIHVTTDMTPNDMICFNKSTKKMDLKQVNTENYTSWHLGYINFESAELHKITTKLERYYDVNIFFENPETANKKITGKLKLKADIDEMLKVLATTSTFKIKKINEHEYLLN